MIIIKFFFNITLESPGLPSYHYNCAHFCTQPQHTLLYPNLNFRTGLLKWDNPHEPCRPITELEIITEPHTHTHRISISRRSPSEGCGPWKGHLCSIIDQNIYFPMNLHISEWYILHIYNWKVQNKCSQIFFRNCSHKWAKCWQLVLI